MLKKTLLLTAFMCVYAILVNNSYVYTNAFQPPTGRTGAPGEQTCASASCHNGTVNSGSGSVDISFSGGGVFEGGETYDVTVVVNDGSGSVFGFEMIALTDDGTSVGAFDANGSGIVAVRTVGSKEYVHHRSAPSSNTFEFKWTAPEENVGNVTFYACGNAANGNGNHIGDLVYTSSFSSVFTDIETYTPEKLSLHTFPNPATSHFNINYQLTQTELMTISAYDASGRLVKVLFEGAENTGVQEHRFDLESNELDSGLYFIMLQSENFVSSTKLFVQ